MKKMILIVPLLLCLVAGTALAEPSTIASDTGFGMTFEDLNDAQAHVLELEQGDALSLSVILSGGSLNIRILQEGGDVLYDSSSIPTPGTSVEIPETGLYRVTISGISAYGSALIRRVPASVLETIDNRTRYERVQSALGYNMQYEPDTFTFTERGEAERDTFTSGDSTLTVDRVDDNYHTVADQYAELNPDAEENLPTVIDYRAARQFKMESGKTVEAVTIIEAGRDATFVVTAIYPSEEAGMSQKMQNMVTNMTFVY